MTTQTQAINLQKLSEHLLSRQSIEVVTEEDKTQLIIISDPIYGKARIVEIVDSQTVKVYPTTSAGDTPKLKSELVKVNSVNDFLTYFLHRWWVKSSFTQQENYEYDKANPEWITEKIFA